MECNNAIGPSQLLKRRSTSHLDLAAVIVQAIELTVLDIVHLLRIDHQNFHVLILLHWTHAGRVLG
ncbi:hypothetical protein D3C80_1606570 [compost metagenome]